MGGTVCGNRGGNLSRICFRVLNKFRPGIVGSIRPADYCLTAHVSRNAYHPEAILGIVINGSRQVFADHGTVLEQQGAAVRLCRTQILVAYGLIIIVYSSEIAIGGGLKIILDISGINIRYTACLGRNQKLDSAVGPCAGTSLCRRSRICFGFCRSCCFLRRCSCGGAVCRRTAG